MLHRVVISNEHSERELFLSEAKSPENIDEAE